MGATLSEQRDSKCEEDEEPHSGQDEVLKDSAGNEVNIRLETASIYKASKESIDSTNHTGVYRCGNCGELFVCVLLLHCSRQ